MDIRLTAVRTAEAETSLIASPRVEAISPDGTEVLLATVDISVAGFSRKKWLGSLWLRPGDGAVLQRVRYKPGEDGTHKVYRYSSDGVFRIVSEPNGAQEATLPPTQWTKSSEQFFPFNLKAESCAEISDPFVLLYVLSSKNPPFDLQGSTCVFNKKAVYHASFEFAGSESVRVNYSWETSGREMPIEREIDALKATLAVRPDDPESEGLEPFEFLGLEGEIEILVDPTLRIPVALRGELPGVGRLGFRLIEASSTLLQPMNGGS